MQHSALLYCDVHSPDVLPELAAERRGKLMGHCRVTKRCD